MNNRLIYSDLTLDKYSKSVTEFAIEINVQSLHIVRYTAT